MSDAIFEQFATGMQTLNTELTKAFVPDGVRCFLLRHKKESSKLEIIRELTGGFWMDFSDFRGQARFEYADPDLTVRDDIAIATHVAYGVPDAEDEIEVYTFGDEPLRDKIDPTGATPYWKMYLDKEEQSRFQLPPEFEWVENRTITPDNIFTAFGSDQIAIDPPTFEAEDVGRRIVVKAGADTVYDGMVTDFLNESEVKVSPTVSFMFAFPPTVILYDQV